MKYGPIETDASFAYARRSGDSLTYAAANMVKVIFDGRTVFAGRTATFALQPDDLSTGYGPPKWRYWEDTVDLSQPEPAAEAASQLALAGIQSAACCPLHEAQLQTRAGLPRRTAERPRFGAPPVV